MLRVYPRSLYSPTAFRDASRAQCSKLPWIAHLEICRNNPWSSPQLYSDSTPVCDPVTALLPCFTMATESSSSSASSSDRSRSCTGQSHHHSPHNPGTDMGVGTCLGTLLQIMGCCQCGSIGPVELAAICGTPSFRHRFLRMSYTPTRLARAHLHLPEVCDAEGSIAANCYQTGILFLQVSRDDWPKVL